ncbi:MAG: glycosyltransferase family 9 protein [Gammaproteobacteria bacterium]|jgi:ADP-heptose:LPS heptosyltransferase|nr:glycosyltransferase family 9 protein [Gammaproteobacteria bacterium]MBT4462670.1 glycosyltransferase family 9 protein [Gammaproteobacteria bacterium]MBT4654917.1 glycosyltransferase family 9 protein [Gammaproteobacteria bacterium]MBT5116583.1 glycosyltransferase family 9 protein [Gammaproteobacteria bacterium]MBT5761790.1 glycosyltransferase family 9 protein [Gammaproteobacteria bacterium]
MTKITKKILIVRNDKIGDFVLILPAVASLKNNIPNSKIVCLVSESVKELAEQCTFIDEVIVDTNNKELFSKLGKYDFDISVTFFSTFRIGYLLKKLNIPLRLAPKTKLAQIFYNHKILQKRSRSRKPEYEYNIDLIYELFKIINLENIKEMDLGPYLKYDYELVTKNRIKFISEYNLNKDKKIIFLHPGTGGSSKGLSLNCYADICKGLRKFDDYNFIIHCSIDEEQFAKDLKLMIYKEVTVRVIEPKKSVLHMFNNISICDLLIAGSTGPLHIAGALNKKTIGFYPEKKSSTSLRWQTINNFENKLSFTDIGNDRKFLTIDVKKSLLQMQKLISSS